MNLKGITKKHNEGDWPDESGSNHKDGEVMKRARDQQRQKVYRWEDSLGLKKGVSDPIFRGLRVARPSCTALIKRACRRYGVCVPGEIVFPRTYRNWARGDRHRIVLPIWAQVPLVVLHEATHGIILNLDKVQPSHGPGFMAVFIDLLDWHGVADEKHMRQLAKDKGLKVAPKAYARGLRTRGR